jgi:fructokinase
VSSFAILGEALVDLRAVDGAEPEHEDRPAARGYLAQPGGSPFNVAVGLARLGRSTEFVGRLATDALGAILRRHAEQSRVSLRLSGTWPGPTPAALFALDRSGSARYDFHLGDAAESLFSAAEVARVMAVPVDAVHFGSLASWLPGSADAVLDAVARLRTRGAFVSYDPNIRSRLIPDRAQTLRRVEDAVALSDLVKASVEDLAWLYPSLSPAQAARRWLTADGGKAVIVTHGAAGADCHSASAILHGGSAPVTVVDTVGAGDAFMADLLDSLAEADALSTDGLAEVLEQPAEVQRLLDGACAHAAATCTRPGADPPWRLPTSMAS